VGPGSAQWSVAQWSVAQWSVAQWSVELVIELKSKPLPRNLPRNLTGVIAAVAVMCARTSRTVHMAQIPGRQVFELSGTLTGGRPGSVRTSS
jgi:hypothetical protein